MAAAGLVYVASPMSLFWSAAFSYENLALPLAAFVVWWLGRTQHQTSRPAQVTTVIAIVAVCATHHVVGFALTALLSGGWLAERLIQRGGAAAPARADQMARSSLGLMTIVAGTTSLAWLLIVARTAGSYLFTNNLRGKVISPLDRAHRDRLGPAWQSVRTAPAEPTRRHRSNHLTS